MHLILNTQNKDLATEFTLYSKAHDIEVDVYRVEQPLFDAINAKNLGMFAFVIEEGTGYARRAISTIKSQYTYVPVVLLVKNMRIKGADIYVPYPESSEELVVRVIIQNIHSYAKNFDKLRCMVKRPVNPIYFGDYVYNPQTRNLSNGESLVKELTVREGGVLEVLAGNFGNMVSKSIVLNTVWNGDDYSKERTLDVYIAKLRKIIKDNALGVRLRTVTRQGIMLESTKKQ